MTPCLLAALSPRSVSVAKPEQLPKPRQMRSPIAQTFYIFLRSAKKCCRGSNAVVLDTSIIIVVAGAVGALQGTDWAPEAVSQNFDPAVHPPPPCSSHPQASPSPPPPLPESTSRCRSKLQNRLPPPQVGPNFLLYSIALGIAVTTSTLRVFGCDQVVRWREVASGYNVLSVFMGSSVFDLLPMTLRPLVFSAIYWSLTATDIPFMRFFVLSWMYSWWCSGLSYIISVMIPSDSALLAGASPGHRHIHRRFFACSCAPGLSSPRSLSLGPPSPLPSSPPN